MEYYFGTMSWDDLWWWAVEALGSFRMAYLLEMIADNRLTDWWLLQEIEVAENKYCRAFAAVIQESPTRRADGKFVH
jgi:hypothetical protein